MASSASFLDELVISREDQNSIGVDIEGAFGLEELLTGQPEVLGVLVRTLLFEVPWAFDFSIADPQW